MNSDDWDLNIELQKEEKYKEWKNIAQENFFKPKPFLYLAPYLFRKLIVQDIDKKIPDHRKIKHSLIEFKESIWPEMKDYFEIFENELKELESYVEENGYYNTLNGLVNNMTFGLFEKHLINNSPDKYMNNLVNKITIQLGRKYEESDFVETGKLVHNVISKAKKSLFSEKYLKNQRATKIGELKLLVREAEDMHNEYVSPVLQTQ